MTTVFESAKTAIATGTFGFVLALMVQGGPVLAQTDNQAPPSGQIPTQGEGPVQEVPDVGAVSIEELPSLPSDGPNAIKSEGEQQPIAVFRGLDKVTARVSQFDARVGEVASFRAFDVTVRRCNKRPPEETPFTTAFVEIAERTLSGEQRDVFKGWMFASSPGLNAVEHPVYDVWLIDCKADAPDKSAGTE